MVIAEDALTLGVRLKREEQIARKKRIHRMFADARRHLSNNDRLWLAEKLYEARYPQPFSQMFEDECPWQSILDVFCMSVFGAPSDEVLEAYDDDIY